MLETAAGGRTGSGGDLWDGPPLSPPVQPLGGRWKGTLTARAILPGMATYTVIPRRDGDGYDIRVVDAEGAYHTMLGFKTEADAMAWIVHDTKIEEARERALSA